MSFVEIESIGKIIQNPKLKELWTSNSVAIPFFDGKELAFTINSELKEDQGFWFLVNEAIENFLRRGANYRLSISNPVYQNYKDIQDYYDSEPQDVPPLELSNESDIWKYIYPYEIYVCRGFDEDKNIYLQLHCNCDWEEEHGLQLVFRNGLELTRISDIDLNPTV